MPRRDKPHRLALQVGQRVRALRQEQDLTIEKLAYESEVGSKGHLSSLEKGLVMPTVETLEKIADRLDVLVVDLVNDPGAGDRQRLIDLSRHLSTAQVRRLARDMTSVRKPSKP